MFFSSGSRLSSLWCPFEKSYLHQIWLVNFFNCPDFFSNCYCNGLGPDRPSSKICLNDTKDLPVKVIKPQPVNPKHCECGIRNILRDVAFCSHQGKIPCAPKQPVSNARCSPASFCDLKGAILCQRDFQDRSTAGNNFYELIHGIQVKS